MIIVFKHVQHEDLLKFGIIPELIGFWLPIIAALHDLDEKAQKILKEPKCLDKTISKIIGYG